MDSSVSNISIIVENDLQDFTAKYYPHGFDQTWNYSLFSDMGMYLQELIDIYDNEKALKVISFLNERYKLNDITKDDYNAIGTEIFEPLSQDVKYIKYLLSSLNGLAVQDFKKGINQDLLENLPS